MPLLGAISLEFVQRVEHSFEAGWTGTRIAGLSGELQARSGRPSHRIRMEGLMIGEGARDALGELQTAAQSGEELTFAADIISALDLQKVVIQSFEAEEVAGHPQQIRYHLEVVESPPLPPPAEVSGFGGLDDFGLGDLGFDTDILEDISDLAGDVAGAVDQALDAVEALESLASLAASGGLNFAGILNPLNDTVENMRSVGGNFQAGSRALGELFGS